MAAISPGSLLSTSISGTFANGSSYNINIQASSDSSATITTELDDVSGVWGNSGASFSSTGFLSKYTVNFYNSTAGLEGTIVYQSVSILSKQMFPHMSIILTLTPGCPCTLPLWP